MSDLKCALIIPDTHRPYHHKRAYNLMLQVAQDQERIDEIVLLGDYADFYAVQQHGASHPLLNQLLAKEVDSVNQGLDELDALFPDAKKVFIEGNHEWRLERFIQSHAAPLYGLIDWQSLFKLNSRPGWRCIPWGPRQRYRILNSKLTARHRPPATNAKSAAARALCNIAYGDIHKIQEAYIKGLWGEEYVSFCVGWLGDTRFDKVFGFLKNHDEWQFGFGLVWVNAKTGYFYHQKVHILPNITCVVNGKLYKG